MDARNHQQSDQVLRELNAMRGRAELTDVVLEVEGRSFPCHRAVLASCSPYFRGMFTSGYAEAKQERVTIKEVNKVAMATILDYAYTGRLQTEPDQVQAVMSAARLFQVDFVCRKAADYMKDHLDVSNCADVLMYADMLEDLTLKEASERYIAFRFNQVALQPAFLKLPLPLLQSLINRDDLMTNSEDKIVQAALRWIKFDKEERLQHLPALCRCFRHPFISSSQLAEVESTRECLPTDCKLAYSDSTTQRLGQTGTEMQIFPGLVREGSTKRGIQWVAPCYDASTGELYAIDVPDNLENFSMTATPDNELYLAGGINNINSISRFGYGAQRKFYQYNHQLNSWESRHEMKSPRIRCGLVYLKGYIYAIGGDVKKKTVERYDPSCDEWTSIRPIPRPVTSDFCAVTLDDSIYVISKEGCYCFSTTENKWSKIADMIQPPLCPQAVTYQGSIYCKDCHKESGYQSSNGVEVYNPTIGEWKLSGNGSYSFDKATLMEYGDTLYLLTGHNNEQSQLNTIYVYKYLPETDYWLYLIDNGKLVPPLVRRLGSGMSTDCLTTRMIPQCLDQDSDAYEELDPFEALCTSSYSESSESETSYDSITGD